MKSEWISVSERMPEPYADIFLAWDSGYVKAGYWSGTDWNPGKNANPPTHWMLLELPKPPEKQAPDAFEEWWNDPNSDSPRWSMSPGWSKELSKFIWDAAVKATAKPSDDRISKDDVKPLVDALNVIIQWDETSSGPPHTHDMLEAARKALAHAKKLGLIK